MTIEYIKIVVSILTPLTIVFVGLLINRNLERRKQELSKEKDWQVEWSKFLLHSVNELNINISSLICSLYDLQGVEQGSERYNEEIEKIWQYRHNLRINEWNIKNYTQFAEVYGQEAIDKLRTVLDEIKGIMTEGEGDTDNLKQMQFNFNKAVRSAHGEILKSNNLNKVKFKKG